MELILNLAWALFAVGLIGLWLRSMRTNPTPRKMQVMALMMIVLLLLPVISLSDDLIAAQGPTETDCHVRRALDAGLQPHSVVPASFILPGELAAEVWLGGYAQEAAPMDASTPYASFFTPSLNRRPPPQA